MGAGDADDRLREVGVAEADGPQHRAVRRALVARGDGTAAAVARHLSSLRARHLNPGVLPRHAESGIGPGLDREHAHRRLPGLQRGGRDPRPSTSQLSAGAARPLAGRWQSTVLYVVDRGAATARLERLRAIAAEDPCGAAARALEPLRPAGGAAGRPRPLRLGRGGDDGRGPAAPARRDPRAAGARTSRAIDVVYTVREDSPDVPWLKRASARLFYRLLTASPRPASTRARPTSGWSRGAWPRCSSARSASARVFLRGLVNWVGFREHRASPSGSPAARRGRIEVPAAAHARLRRRTASSRSAAPRCARPSWPARRCCCSTARRRGGLLLGRWLARGRRARRRGPARAAGGPAVRPAARCSWASSASTCGAWSTR